MVDDKSQTLNKKFIRMQILTTFLIGLIISLCLTATTFSYILSNHIKPSNILENIYIILFVISLIIMIINFIIYAINYYKIKNAANNLYIISFINYVISEVWFFLLIALIPIFSYFLFKVIDSNNIWEFALIMFIQLIISIFFIVSNVKFLIKYIKIINETFIYKNKENFKII